MNTRETFKSRLNYFINRSGKNKKQISDEMGIPYTTLVEWANGKRFPRADGIELLADYFNILKSDLLEEKDFFNLSDNIIPLPNMNRVPLLGTIACGEPILARENLEGEVVILEDIKADFALRCKGDSMIDARIMDGDIVYIRQQPIVENGEIAAVLIDDEATLKRVYLSENTITLMACNAKYQPLVYTGSQLEEVRIIGKAVGFTSAVV